MIDALPPGVLQLSHRVTGIVDEGDGVRVEFEEQSPVTVDIVVGADGIDSLVRRTLWGDSPVLEHDLHIIGGYFLVDGKVDTRGVWAHGRTVQGPTLRSATRAGSVTSGGCLKHGRMARPSPTLRVTGRCNWRRTSPRRCPSTSDAPRQRTPTSGRSATGCPSPSGRKAG